MAPVVHLAGPVRPELAVPPAPLPVITRLSLAELLLLADRSGHPRLPLDLDAAAEDTTSDRLEERLSGGTPSSVRRARGLLASAHDQVADDPDAVASRLIETGLLDADGTPAADVVAALAVLAAPEAMLVLDLAVRRPAGEVRLRSYVAVAGTSVTQLSTVSGLAYELAWFDVDGLPDALTRAATVEDDPVDPAEADEAVQAGEVVEADEAVELPFEVFTDGTEAVRRGREDLLAEVVRIAPAPARVGGVDLSPAATAQLVTALETGSLGRLRVLVAVPEDGAVRRTVGVVSWLRTDSTWRELSARTVDGVPTVRLTPVTARDLPRAVAPVLAQVVR